MGDLTLPLTARPSQIHGGQWVVVDAYGQPVEITPHRAEIIVAALTRDQEEN